MENRSPDVVCCTTGILALFLLPVLAKNTDISKNAFMPGSASPMLSNQHVSDGNRLVKDLTSSNLKSSEAGIESQRIIGQYMLNSGAKVSFHKFHPQFNQFHPLHLFSRPDSGIIQENYSCS